VLEGNASIIKRKDWESKLYQPLKTRSIKIRLIPYYAWSNRGVSEMTVWLPCSSF
jgi:DUF1680 family protein